MSISVATVRCTAIAVTAKARQLYHRWSIKLTRR